MITCSRLSMIDYCSRSMPRKWRIHISLGIEESGETSQLLSVLWGCQCTLSLEVEMEKWPAGIQSPKGDSTCLGTASSDGFESLSFANPLKSSVAPQAHCICWWLHWWCLFVVPLLVGDVLHTFFVEIFFRPSSVTNGILRERKTCN